MDHNSIPRQPSALPLLLVTALFLLFFLFNPQVIADWRVYSFDDGTYSHAYLMLLVIAFLYWRAWRQQQLLVRWNPWFFLLFIASLLLYLWLTIAQLAFFSRLAMPLVLAFMLASLLRVNASVLVPVSLVWFITPVWNGLNGVLQKISVMGVNQIMRFTDVPTLVEGNFVHIPSGTFEIADGCSGLRYLITALALAIIYCFLNLTRKRAIAIFFLAAIAGALVTNWIRIALLIYIGDYTEMQSSLINDHNTFGWYIFVPFVFLLFYFGGKLEPPQPPPPPLVPVQRGGWPVVGVGAVLAVLAVISGLSIHLYQQGDVRWLAPTFDLGSAVPGTREVERPSPVVFVWSRRVAEQLQVDGTTVLVQRYFFDGETDAHKADFYLNSAIPDGWSLIDRRYTEGRTVLLLADPQGRRAVVHYWYQAGQRQSGNARQFRIHRLLEALRLNQGTALHWYFAYCTQSDCELESAQLGRIVAASPGNQHW